MRTDESNQILLWTFVTPVTQAPSPAPGLALQSASTQVESSLQVDSLLLFVAQASIFQLSLNV